MANIKSAIKRAELNKVANERNAQQNLQCVLLSKNLKLHLLKNFTELLLHQLIKLLQKALSMLTKHHVIKHVLLLNLAN